MASEDVTILWANYNAYERDGIRGITEVLRVKGANATRAIGGQYAPDVPNYRAQHRDHAENGLIVKDRNATQDGAGALVSVTYAPEEYVGWNLPPVNVFQEDFVGKDVSFETEDVEIPLFRTANITLGDGAQAVQKTVFQRVDGVLPYRKRVSYYRVPIAIELVGSTLGDVLNLSRVILEQTDKIHNIFGEDLVFACEGITQQTAERFNAVYRWYKDPGIKLTELRTSFGPSAGTNLRFIGSTAYPVFNDDFLIPPYKGLRIDGDPDPEQPPTVTYFDIYEREPNGWQTLPGIA